MKPLPTKHDFKWLLGLLIGLTLITACLGNNSNQSNNNPPAVSTPPTATPRPEVEVIGNCMVDGPFPDNTTCTTVSVTCANLPPATAELRITPANPDTAYIGTILLGSGGTGDSFLSSDSPSLESPALGVVLELSAAGYTIVERKWREGWFGEGSKGLGIIDPSCRHAKLLSWLDARAESPGAFCAYGNSGGSSEIAYGLTRWNTESLLDFVVLGGGPPMARLDAACLGFDYDPDWERVCTEKWNSTQEGCQRQRPVCALADRSIQVGARSINAAFSIAELRNLCTGSSTTFAEVFSDNSVLYPGADLAYPNTPVHFIYGRQDCTEAVTIGPLYLDAITSEKSVEYLDGVGHEIHHDQSGAEAVVNALKNQCALSPG